MKKMTITGLALTASVAPIIYLAFVYQSLPLAIPTRYNWNMAVSQTAPKETLWWFGSLLSLLSIGIYLLFANLHRLDKKGTAKKHQPVFTIMGLGLSLFMSVTNVFLIASANNGPLLQKTMLPLAGLLVAFLGACLARTSPNSVAGFRLPWALRNEGNWRKTHRLASRFWVVGGLALTVASLALPFAAAFAGFVVMMLVITLVPGFYSYYLFSQTSRLSH